MEDGTNETISIVKIPKLFLFYDSVKLINIVNFNGEIFKTPFKYKLEKKIFSQTSETLTEINSKKLNINYSNNSFKNKKNIEGLNKVSILNFKLLTDYIYSDKLFLFNSQKSQSVNKNVQYNGKLNLDPFDLDWLSD